MERSARGGDAASEALRRLAPVWHRLHERSLLRHDERDLAQRVAALPALPHAEHLDGLAATLDARLARWEEQAADPAALAPLIAQALAGLYAARLVGAASCVAGLLGAVVRGLEDLYLIQGSPADLDLRVSLLEAANAQSELQSWQPAWLHALGRALRDRYLARGEGADLEDAGRLLDEALRRAPTPAVRAQVLNDLARIARDRYLQQDTAEDLATSIRLLEAALQVASHARIRAECSSNLGLALYLRYMLDGDPADLARCIQTHEGALRDAPRGVHRPRYLNNLAIALDYRYRQSGDVADLEARVRLQEEAYALVPFGAERRIYASNLGNVLRDRFALRGDPADLEARLRLQAEAVALTPNGPQRAHCLNNLGNAHADRYALRGDPGDLDAAIVLLGEAVALSPAGPYRPMFLDNQGLYVLRRYAARGEAADLAQAVTLLEEALALTPSGPERAARLNSLGSAIHARFARTHALEDLDRALALLEEAAALTPQGPNRPEYLSELSRALGDRVTLRGDPGDVERQVALLQEAVALAGTWELPALARSLGELLLRLATTAGREAAQAYRVAAAGALARGADGLERMLVAAEEQVEAGLLGQFGDLYDLLITVELELAEAATQAGDPAAVSAHRLAAYQAAERGKGRRAAALLAARAARPAAPTLSLLPRLDELRRELARLDRQLAGLLLVPTAATAAGFRGGWLSEEAKAGAAEPVITEASPASAPHAALRPALTERSEAVWAEMQEILERIARTDPGYAAIRGFARPLPPAVVAAALPPGGALLMLYPLEDRLACFVVRQPPPEGAGEILSAGTAALGRADLAALVEQVFPPGRAGAPPHGAVLDAALTRLARVLHPLLWPLLPPFDAAHPPNLVVVPTGALHRLPLHACPWPSVSQGRLLDGYTVSYVTTADVLPLTARKEAAAGGLTALAPGLPSLAHDPPLNAALAEATALADAAGGRALLREQANLTALIADRVAAGRRWVLFATHGRAGGARSGLLFYDEQGREPVWLSAADILSLLDVEGIDHLVLGACSTHADDPAPGDRLAGLLRALLYRGARSVQAALWPVRDDAAALVSTWTWDLLLAGQTDKAAALRSAVQRLRRCTGGEAATELHRLAGALPPDDPARDSVQRLAGAVAGQAQPFLRTSDWAPFVLQGAPHVCAAPRSS